MKQVNGIDFKLENLPDLIRSVHPNGKAMHDLANRLEPILHSIMSFIGNESVFMRNHFKHKLLLSNGTVDVDKVDFFNSLVEGLWHLHVAWSLRQEGFILVPPTKDDDLVIDLGGKKIAYEITLSDLKLHSDSRLTNKKVVTKILKAVKKKDDQIFKRNSGLSTIIVLNDHRVTNDNFNFNGNESKEFPKRLTMLSKELGLIRRMAALGVIYTSVKYENYFTQSIFPAPLLVQGVPLYLPESKNK